jgi:hypothetical protein
MNLAWGRTMAADMVPATRWQVGLRNHAMRTLRFNPLRGRIIERMLRPLHEAANGIDLPPYPVPQRR